MMKAILMKIPLLLRVAILAAAFSALMAEAGTGAWAREALPLSEIRLPPGFKISLFADDVPGARSMTLSPNGVLFVGTRKEGKVYAVVDANQDGKAEALKTIAAGLNSPNGVAFRDGALYVAEINRVLRFDAIEDKLDNPPKPAVVTEAYPAEGHHGWKFIAFGPDGKLYVPVGAPCNVCDPENPIFASITRIDPKGGAPEIVAKGVRNSVGFDWHPATRELWFTDNGRDWLGDDLPPDELNRVEKPGQHFGFPYCHGNGLVDTEFGAGKDCKTFTPPVQELGPHVASLGMRFYSGSAFPAEYRNQIFIAEHGSWNRSRKIGYRVSLVTLDGPRAVGYKTFAEGWLKAGGGVRGRPVDVLVRPDGSLLVSDDYAGAIYRITYGP
jgi:glucose/arabinose dehydrogenase